MSTNEDIRTFSQANSVDITIEKDLPSGETLEWKPPLTTEVTANQVGESEELVDLCGNRERRSDTDSAWQLDVGGLALQPDVAAIRRMDLANSEVRIITDILGEDVQRFAVDDVEITQEEGQSIGRFPDRPLTQFTREQANERRNLREGLLFSFSLQTEDPSSENNGGLLG